MKTSFILFFVILVCFKTSAQDKRFMINGKISSDSIAVENIHIINKTSRKATISDKTGSFQIPVKENDILLISSVQFKNKLITIKKFNISTLTLIIKLKLKINSLDEVSVIKPQNIAKGLGLPNASKKPLNKLESRLNYHSTASLARVFLSIILEEQGNINDMYYIISRNRKKDRKLATLLEKDKFETFQQQQLQNIRIRLMGVFFTETLKIPTKEIENFITYCDTQDVFYLFSKNRTLEVIDIFVKESESYLEKQKSE